MNAIWRALALADLMLDTLPYNAHATASDALWAGVPVVTCAGQAFAGRVAASLLKAAGLPELVAQTLADYESLALKLARDPQWRAALRETLLRNRRHAPFFDSRRHARMMEAAFRQMWRHAQSGAAPKGFAVTLEALCSGLHRKASGWLRHASRPATWWCRRIPDGPGTVRCRTGAWSGDCPPAFA